MPFVVVRRPKVTRIPDVERIMRVVPERRESIRASRLNTPSRSAGKRVVGIQAEVLCHVLTVAEVESVIPRTVDGLLVHDAAQHGNSRCSKSSRQRTRFACDNRIAARILSQNSDGRVNVNRLVFMKAELVDVFDFHDRVLRRGPLISEVKLLGNRIAIFRVHQSSRCTSNQGR